MNTVQIFEKLYVTKDFQDIFQSLENKNDKESIYLCGKIFFEQHNFDKAVSYFEKINDYCQIAKCRFFQKNLRASKNFLNKIQDKDMEADWFCFLIDVVEGKIRKLPTFFQVRNFLEVDLSILLETGNIEYAEKLINASEYFVQANAEANKFFARALYNYNYIGLSQIFLDKSLDIYYKDPETLFLKAQCYLAEDKKEEAKDFLRKCLENNEGYFPAQKLLKEIK